MHNPLALFFSFVVSFSGVNQTSIHIKNEVISPIVHHAALSQLNDILWPSPSPSPTPTPTPRPTPVPTPAPFPSFVPVTGSELDDWFTKYASSHQIDRELLHKIAVCESYLNPLAQNGIYAGMYQYSPAAWKSTRFEMQVDTDPDLRFNPEEAIKTTAFHLEHHGATAWPHCGK